MACNCYSLVHFNLVTGHLLSGTITQEEADQLLDDATV